MINLIKYSFLFLCVMLFADASAQSKVRYRITLVDKALTEFSLEHPEAYLSAKALNRRAKQNLDIDSTDLPVCREYIRQIQLQGARYVLSSKWNNTILVELDSVSTAIQQIQQLPFVASVKKVWMSSSKVNQYTENRKKEVTNDWVKQRDSYGMSHTQMAIHKGDSLHFLGYRGKGIDIAIIDAGFYNVDVMKLFRKTKVLGTRDFVDPNSDIYAEHNHGLKVFSCLGANVRNVLVGTAPEANYWLLRSEDNATEQPIEEDYWTAAVEFSDSVGVDVINTSLGYHAFDAPFGSYKYNQLNGHSSLMSCTASRIADKGMVLVCSAGNAGSGSWKKITPPADAENVISVGAIKLTGINTDFSSVGNTTDGRIKPDVMALGYKTSVAGTDGGTSYANGTSFSSPIFCGLVACLWQACPWLTSKQLVEVVLKAGNNTEHPDNVYGYGVVDIYKAYQFAQQLKP